MRQTLQSLFGFDLPTAQKWVIAFGVILVLLVLLGLFARQIKDGRLRIKGQGGGRTRQPRLGVVDIHDLDRQRQLVLIRRDNVEHLVMIGGPSDVVVETNIVRSGARSAMPAQPDLGLPDRPLPFDTLVPPELARQEPVRQEPARQDPPRQDPPRQEPRRLDVAEDARRAPPAPVAHPVAEEELPPLPSRSTPRTVQTQAEAAVAAAAGGAAVLGAVAVAKAPSLPTPPAPVVQPPNFARDHAPAPTASAVELDDMARQLDEALKRPFSAVRSSQAMASAPVAVPAKVQAEPVPAVNPPEPVAAPEPVKPEPLPPVPEPAPAARALPLDVEAELEMALGLKPERTVPKPGFGAMANSPPKSVETTKPPEPAQPAEPVRPVEPEPVAALEPEPLEPPAAVPELSPAFLSDLEAQLRRGEDPSAAEAAPALVDVVTKGDRPADVPPAAPDAPEAESAEAEPDGEPKPIDPFSVDAIEAEFARLLGRDPKAKA